jgi:hypothetical protein
MAEFENVAVTLQSGIEVQVHSWTNTAAENPLVIVAPGTATGDWDEFASLLSPSHAPILVDVSSALELLHFIWEIGEPVALLSQGDEATGWVSDLVGSSPAAATSITICDGEISADQISGMHAISTLILRGRQGKLLSHESAVVMHESIRHSTLAEPEDCGDFPAKDNADAAASAVNWFLAGSGRGDNEFSDAEPIDPKL